MRHSETRTLLLETVTAVEYREQNIVNIVKLQKTTRSSFQSECDNFQRQIRDPIEIPFRSESSEVPRPSIVVTTWAGCLLFMPMHSRIGYRLCEVTCIRRSDSHSPLMKAEEILSDPTVSFFGDSAEPLA